jgi:hypothetical protein
MLKTKELFELPVYRLEEDKYNQSLCEHIVNNPLMSAEYSRKNFGGDWQYNEIIGFLRFYVFTYQVNAKFVVNTGKQIRKGKLKAARSNL